MSKKKYFNPEVQLIHLDYTITLQMKSHPPKDPPPRPPKPPKPHAGSVNSPFASPFEDKPFN